MKINKIIIITAAILAVFGSVIAYIAAINGGVGVANYEMHTEAVTEEVSKISITESAGDVRIVPVKAEDITVRYSTSNIHQCDISVEDKTLSIEAIPMNELGIKWYDYITIGYGNESDILVEIPEKLLCDLVINVDLGDIEIAGGSYKTVECKNDCGDIELTGITADSFNIENSKGDIDLENTVGSISAFTAYGDVDIENISSDDIKITNNLGDITGSIKGLKEEYTITAETDMGDNNLRNNSNGGSKKLDVKTDLGDIEIKFRP